MQMMIFVEAPRFEKIMETLAEQDEERKPV